MLAVSIDKIVLCIYSPPAWEALYSRVFGFDCAREYSFTVRFGLCEVKSLYVSQSLDELSQILTAIMERIEWFFL